MTPDPDIGRINQLEYGVWTFVQSQELACLEVQERKNEQEGQKKT